MCEQKIGSRENDENPKDPSDHDFRELITQVIRSLSKSRSEIADQLSARLRRTVTKGMLDDFTVASKQGVARFPAAWVPAFCEVTGDDRLQRQLLSPRLAKLLELAELELANELNQRRRQSLRDELLASMEERGRS